MRIAFYAPLTPPHDPVPSGDRRVARLLIDALGAAGHEVELASVFRSRDPSGEAGRQRRLMGLGGRLAERLVRRYRARPPAMRPDAWMTYHLYYKAPDWIGPRVSAALKIPYILAEASHAPKRADGKWSMGHAAAEAAIRRADAVISLNSHDSACVRPLLDHPARLCALRPFTDIAPFTRAAAARQTHRARLIGQHDLDPAAPLLLTVAMMRPGDKLASYRVLATALASITDHPWQLLVIGDGEARADVAQALAPLGADRVRYTGVQPTENLAEYYAAADILAWPAIREAYGMALLEAQAAGLPVVAGDSGGVGDIVRHGETGLLSPEGNAPAFAEALAALVASPSETTRLAANAATVARRDHSMRAGAAGLDAVLAGIAAETAA